jgi:hypothetical protein
VCVMVSIILEGLRLSLSSTSRRSGNAVTRSARTIAVKVARNSLDEGRRINRLKARSRKWGLKTEEVTQGRRLRCNKSSHASGWESHSFSAAANVSFKTGRN